MRKPIHNTIMGQVYCPEEINEKLKKRVIRFLRNWEGWSDKSALMNWKSGATMSFLKQVLIDDGWVNLGNPLEFQCLLHKAGFVLIPAKLKNGENHKSARVVYPIDEKETKVW